jgi:membrane-associated phospholipid phosphatase
MSDKKIRFGMLSAGLGVVFLCLSILVNRAAFKSIDYTVLMALHATIGRKYRAFMSVSSLIGSPEVTLLVVGVIFVGVYLMRRRAPLGLSLFFALFAVEFWGKSVLFHPDPPSLVSRRSLGLGSSGAPGLHLSGSMLRSGLICAAVLVAVAVVYILFRRRRLLIALSVLFVLIVVSIWAILFLFHPGPVWYLVRHSSVLYPLRSLLANMEFSFPSGHMARTTFVCVILLGLLDAHNGQRTQKVLGTLLAVLLVMAMSVSLVSLGYHWFSDVLGGIALGASLAFLALFVDGLGSKRSMPVAVRAPAPGCDP